jgi:hypothetical protein
MRPVVLPDCTNNRRSVDNMQVLECIVSGPLPSSGSDSPVALLSSCVRGGNWQAVEHPLPPALSQFINTFLGERAVARETVKKAAPAFRRYDGSF